MCTKESIVAREARRLRKRHDRWEQLRPSRSWGVRRITSKCAGGSARL